MSTTPPVRLHVPWLLAALTAWAVLSLGHGTGLDIVTAIVSWAREPGALSEAGGQAGADLFEVLLALAVGGLFLGALLLVLHRLHRAYGALALLEQAPAWVLCAALAWLAWRVIIIYTTELVHFAQYALIGALLSLAIDRGRRPQRAFLAAFALGVIDEIWQHYGLHVWLLGERTHYLDVSDPFLNGIGAFAGVLPAATWLRLRGDGATDRRWVAGATAISCLALPLLLVDPATLSGWFGSYPYYPFWDEHTNLKAVHWLTLYEGLPLIPAFLLIVGSVLDPERPAPTVGSLALAALLIGIAIHPLSRERGMPVHEQVPHALVRPVASEQINLDGVLSEAAWQDAPPLGPFVDNETGSHRADECVDAHRLPLTEARVLWSPDALFVGVRVVDDDIWSPDVPRDHAGLLTSEGLRILVDDGGDEVLFYELALAPSNRVADMLHLVAAAPLDFNPWSATMGFLRFDAPDVVTAVAVDGSMEWAGAYITPVASPPDRGYTAEVRIPWDVFRNSARPSANSVRMRLPPEPGQRWRLGLYRFEAPRPDAALPDRFTVDEARALLGMSEAQWQTLLELRQWQPEGGTIPASWIWGEHVGRCGRWQAWSPTYRDPLRPARFGVIEFGS